MAKKNLSQSSPTTPQKPVPASAVIAEATESLKRAEDHLKGVDGILGIFAEVDRAADYVSLENVANGFSYILLGIKGQLAGIREQLSKLEFDGQGNAVGIKEGGK